MKTEPNTPINAQPLAPNGQVQCSSDLTHLEGMGALTGITLRQHHAGLAMVGYLSSYPPTETANPQYMAQHSVEYADALIAALNK